jgi:hypothetical protein
VLHSILPYCPHLSFLFHLHSASTNLRLTIPTPPLPRQRSTTSVTALPPQSVASPQGATVPNIWRYEFVICSQKGKNVTGVPVSAPDSRPLPPRRHLPVQTLRGGIRPRSLNPSSPPPSVYLIEVIQSFLLSPRFISTLCRCQPMIDVLKLASLSVDRSARCCSKRTHDRNTASRSLRSSPWRSEHL